jgi:hypothetical protein
MYSTEKMSSAEFYVEIHLMEFNLFCSTDATQQTMLYTKFSSQVTYSESY